MSKSLADFAINTRLANLKEYLRLQGWAPIAHKNTRIEVYRHFDQSVSLEVVIPRSQELVDYGTRVTETVETLAALSKQTSEAVFTQISEINEDVLRARVMAVTTDHLSIPLDMAVSVISGLKRLLTYSAAGEDTALPFYSRATKKALTHTEHCRFGHTFVGSFGFTIESPLAPAVQTDLIPGVAGPPYERRVMERLYRGLVQLGEAVTQGDLAPIVTNYATGLSANMCDALLEITQSATNQEVGFVVNWSPRVVPAPELARLSSGISIGASATEYLEAVSKQLRRMEESRPITIDGRVVLLKSDSQPWEDEPDDLHTVVIAWLHTDGKAVKTRTVLAPADYITACNAHMQGLTVSVSGTLERRGKYTRLINPESFGLGRQGTLLIE